MVDTYGGRGGEQEGIDPFRLDVSEIVYWMCFQEDYFWDNKIDSLSIEEEIRAKRPAREEQTRRMVEEYFDEVDRL